MQSVSLEDIVSISAQRDCIIVLPTLGHSLLWWPKTISAVKDRHAWAHGGDTKYVTNTRTAIIMQDVHRLIRLWVPYARQPTMPMDLIQDRHGKELLNLYGLYRGGLA